MYLLDTNVVSLTAPTKAVSSDAIANWMNANTDRLYLSVITASEVVHGIIGAQRSGAVQKAARLQTWWSAIERHYSHRFLAFDLDAAHAAGRIADRARAFAPQYQDIAIAATAEVHGLTVLTFNERHFAPLGVPYLNPLKELPALPR